VRLKSVIVALLFMAFNSQARIAPTVSGIAVAAQWYASYPANQSPNDQSGNYGKIIKYAITNGVASPGTVLWNGPSRAATISPDGRWVAFMNQDNTISLMSIDGGNPWTIVSNLANSRSQMSWPLGTWTWLYYTQGCFAGTSADYQLMRVNVWTGETQLVTTFNYGIWQVQVSGDGKRAVARPCCDWNGDAGFIACFRFQIASQVELKEGSALEYDFGCGCGISFNGNYVMNMPVLSHDKLTFRDWSGKVLANIPMGVIDNWGTYVGLSMDDNRFCSNDDKWICVEASWNARSTGTFLGSNQVLVNWVDSQTIVTSNSLATSENPQWNEPGSFWVSNPAPIQTAVAAPAMRMATGAHPENFVISVFDVLGRRVKSPAASWDNTQLHGASLQPGVYCVQLRSGKIVQTFKLY
jgi:hypothetical protein